MHISGIERFDPARWARLGIFLIVTAAGAGGCKDGQNDGQKDNQIQPRPGCQSDRDCKADRICVDHACTAPPAPAAPAQRVRSQVKQAVTTRHQLSWYKSLLDTWFQNNPDRCPSSFDELVQDPRFRDRHKDGWGRPYVLKCGDTAPAGQTFGVVSLGPDGQEGTGDDLRTW